MTSFIVFKMHYFCSVYRGEEHLASHIFFFWQYVSVICWIITRGFVWFFFVLFFLFESVRFGHQSAEWQRCVFTRHALTKVSALSVYGGQIRCHVFINSVTFTISKRGSVQTQYCPTRPLHTFFIIPPFITWEDMRGAVERWTHLSQLSSLHLTLICDCCTTRHSRYK